MASRTAGGPSLAGNARLCVVARTRRHELADATCDRASLPCILWRTAS